MIINTYRQFKNEISIQGRQVITLFYNNWNGSCNLAKGILEELLNQHNYPVRLLLVDVDILPEIMKTYGIHKIPSILFFKDGKVIDQVTGLHSKADIENKISELIDNENISNN